MPLHEWGFHIERGGQYVVEDTKGARTAKYRIKCALMLAVQRVHWVKLVGQRIEAAHVFCGTYDAEMTYSIGSRNFIIVEFPNDPMDGVQGVLQSKVAVRALGRARSAKPDRVQLHVQPVT